MRQKQLLFLSLFLLPFIMLNAQQGDKWKLYDGCKKIIEGMPDAPGSAVISSTSKHSMVVKYSGTGNAAANKRSILIFDTERHQLWKKELTRNYGKFKFNIAMLREKTHNNRFNIFTVAIPSNPEEAALVRVMPVLLCEVSWK